MENKKVLRLRLWFCLLTLTFCLLTFDAAIAALKVSPSRVVLQGEPEKKLTGFFTVENTGEETLQLQVEPEDWGEGLGGSRGSVGWIRVRPNEFKLKSGKHRRVKYTIKIPEDASGELRAQVFFTTETITEGSMPIRSRLGSIIYVGVKGTEKIRGEIKDVKVYYTATTPGIDQPDRLDLAINIRNRGNAHIIPEGKVIVRDKDGEIATTLALPVGWGLLPNEEDTYHAIGHGVYLPPGHYEFEIAITIGGDLRHPSVISRTLQATVAKDGSLNLKQKKTSTP